MLLINQDFHLLIVKLLKDIMLLILAKDSQNILFVKTKLNAYIVARYTVSYLLPYELSIWDLKSFLLAFYES